MTLHILCCHRSCGLGVRSGRVSIINSTTCLWQLLEEASRPQGSKAPNRRYRPKTRSTIPNIQTLHNYSTYKARHYIRLYFGTPLKGPFKGNLGYSIVGSFGPLGRAVGRRRRPSPLDRQNTVRHQGRSARCGRIDRVDDRNPS